jgi:mannose-6-phosphate isomerase
MPQLPLLSFLPAVRHYVWGGRALAEVANLPPEQADQPIAEIWAIYEQNTVRGGEFSGATLAELTQAYPRQILGEDRPAGRFPLLIKLLDCARWLSLQVHPNDAQARALEGEGFMGKTEAWHILAAEPQAELIAGIEPGTSPQALRAAIGTEAILPLVQRHFPQAGDTIYMPAGTIHALGPGLLVYEVQQTSDLTYRVFDWNRPQSDGRVLHVEKSIAVTDPQAQGEILRPGSGEELLRSPYFDLSLLSTPQERNTAGRGFHALTVTRGEAQVYAAGQSVNLSRFQSLLVPAETGAYRLEGDFSILCASAA